jgi:enolase
VLALDVAASEMYRDGGYVFHKSSGERRSASEMVGVLQRLGRALPDPLHRGRARRERLGRLEGADRRARRPVQLVGDDLFVTNTERLQEGIAAASATRS